MKRNLSIVGAPVAVAIVKALIKHGLITIPTDGTTWTGTVELRIQAINNGLQVGVDGVKPKGSFGKPDSNNRSGADDADSFFEQFFSGGRNKRR